MPGGAPVGGAGAPPPSPMGAPPIAPPAGGGGGPSSPVPQAAAGLPPIASAGQPPDLGGAQGGYADGGSVGGDMPKASDFDKGVSPSRFNATAGSRSDALDAAQRELSENAQHRYAKGGAVGKAPWRKWGW